MLLLIVQSLYFILPAYFANMAPVIVSRLNFLNKPLDFGKYWNGKPILGANKTWRGLFFAVLFGLLIFGLQKQLYVFPFFQNISLINYGEFGFALGFLLSFGAIAGDALGAG